MCKGPSGIYAAHYAKSIGERRAHLDGAGEWQAGSCIRFEATSKRLLLVTHLDMLSTFLPESLLKSPADPRPRVEKYAHLRSKHSQISHYGRYTTDTTRGLGARLRISSAAATPSGQLV